MNKRALDHQLSYVSADIRSFAADLRAWFRSGLTRVTGADRRLLAERFSTWVENCNDPGLDPSAVEQLRLWIGDLDLQGRQALTQQLADFCDAFDIDLAWIVDGELTEWTQLHTLLGAMIIRYCLACKAAVDADDQMRQFRHRRVWRRKLKAAAKTNTFAASGTAI